MAEILAQTQTTKPDTLMQIGALSAKLIDLTHRVDALEERIGVVRSLVDAALHAPPWMAPPAPMPGVHVPPWLPGPSLPSQAPGSEVMQHANAIMARRLQQIRSILDGEGASGG